MCDVWCDVCIVSAAKPQGRRRRRSANFFVRQNYCCGCRHEWRSELDAIFFGSTDRRRRLHYTMRHIMFSFHAKYPHSASDFGPGSVKTRRRRQPPAAQWHNAVDGVRDGDGSMCTVPTNCDSPCIRWMNVIILAWFQFGNLFTQPRTIALCR